MFYLGVTVREASSQNLYFIPPHPGHVPLRTEVFHVDT
jgi:hypothetical protein